MRLFGSRSDEIETPSVGMAKTHGEPSKLGCRHGFSLPEEGGRRSSRQAGMTTFADSLLSAFGGRRASHVALLVCGGRWGRVGRHAGMTTFADSLLSAFGGRRASHVALLVCGGRWGRVGRHAGMTTFASSPLSAFGGRRASHAALLVLRRKVGARRLASRDDNVRRLTTVRLRRTIDVEAFASRAFLARLLA